jgi:hypothetical protein
MVVITEAASQQDEQYNYDQDDCERVHGRFRFALRFTPAVTLPTGATIVRGFGGGSVWTTGVTTISAGVSSLYFARYLQKRLYQGFAIIEPQTACRRVRIPTGRLARSDSAS